MESMGGGRPIAEGNRGPYRTPFLLLQGRHINWALPSDVSPPFEWARTWSTVKFSHVSVSLHDGQTFLSSPFQSSRRCSGENARLLSFRSNRLNSNPRRISARRTRFAELSVSP